MLEMASQKDDKRDTIDETEIRTKAHRWCKDSIGGAWSKITADEMIMDHVSGGMSNYLYLCRLPNCVKPLDQEPDQVLLRIYGHITTSNMDVLVHNSVVFALLSEKRLGPKPYGMFFDGRIEEFIMAKPLTHTDLSRPEIMQMVAEKLAAFHSLDMPLCKEPRWMFNIIKREIVLKLDSPVVFCHNDLQEGNILYDGTVADPDKRMTIIDWEYGNYNYRGFDLANHFCEWAISYNSNSFSMEPERYPTRQQQCIFFQHYLKALGKSNVSEETLSKMYVEVNTFAMASHFLWGTWATVQGHTSSINFCYWDYAASRFEEYFKLKEHLPTFINQNM
ncbi:hypothetical protein C0Q70_05050 [Pomacea canaliculata]|uniref:ethanolamine kinase n=1 Tax=Pomacea canaliculata TaxID=400727 RepID=A0A2T7PK26_POMCA|nr:hypothetical protein C0Q70_05050 [Pomacea canaliculata]